MQPGAWDAALEYRFIAMEFYHVLPLVEEASLSILSITCQSSNYTVLMCVTIRLAAERLEAQFSVGNLSLQTILLILVCIWDMIHQLPSTCFFELGETKQHQPQMFILN